MDSYLYHLHALSALHVGAGQGTGVIDLPIARERASQLPYVPGSGIKGVLREHRRPVLPSNPHQAAAWLAAYGPEQDSTNGAGFQGADQSRFQLSDDQLRHAINDSTPTHSDRGVDDILQ